MPYNPTVNDRSGEILAAYQIKAAEQDMQTKQFLGEQIGNVGTALTGVLKQKQEEASKATAIGEALNTMQSTLPTYGAEGVALQQIITKRMADAGNNLDKMSGIYMAFQPAMQNLQTRYNQAAQIEGYKDLADYKSANTPAAATAQPKLDANYGRQFYQALIQQGKMTHEQALAEMDKAGLGYARQYIEKQENPFWK
jgi:hypothetical protein